MNTTAFWSPVIYASIFRSSRNHCFKIAGVWITIAASTRKDAVRRRDIIIRDYKLDSKTSLATTT